jgi:thioredoxin-like negative regulator of GroEL
VAATPHHVGEPERGRPRLVFFFDAASGRSRRAEGYLAQVLQRRRNHDTFDLVRVDVARRPDLAERFRIDVVPTFVVVEGRRARKRIVAPSGCLEIEKALQQWLR